MYPSYDEVFGTDDLLGVFYPLCTVVSPQYGPLHFVSSNGLWMDEQFATDVNAHSFTMFRIGSGKYCFDGDVRLYAGATEAQRVFPVLQEDFAARGEHYLDQRVTSEEYVRKMSDQLPTPTSEFDLDYYLHTFYAFSVTRLCYITTGVFGNMIGVSGILADSLSSYGPAVHETEDEYTSEMLQLSSLPEARDGLDAAHNFVNSLVSIGMVIGSEFFHDGNDEALYYDAERGAALIVNCYG